MLQSFLTENHNEIVARTRAKVAERLSPRATEDELRNGVPLFLNQLIEMLGAPQSVHETTEAIRKSAALHGRTLLAMGFTVAQVVYDYGDICQVVTQLADETGAPITTGEFHTLNRYLDEAIAQAVTEYTNRREQTIVDRETVHLGALTRAMRSRLSATLLSFDLLRKGSVGIGGSTGTALGRGLSGLRALVDGAFARVHLDSGTRRPERVLVAELLEQMSGDAAIDAHIRGVQLTVIAPDARVAVSADRQLLEAAVSKLIQNAVRFSRLNGRALVKAAATTDRVVIEVHDACGGLTPARAELVFRSVDGPRGQRSESGVGLSIARACIEADGGTLRARDVPTLGCVLGIELPRMAAQE